MKKDFKTEEISKTKALTLIFCWLYRKDKQFDSVSEWRTALCEMLVDIINRIDESKSNY